ncbi:MAG TPA: hypothetical protein DEO40_04875 [Treponema sp.]|jgi:hypothetical protein|nr:hypothetical protein [Treponema sp.]HBB43456.1 hypothetical protein [Treponema sp.]HCA19988.1 hypothetical protein [Treponema sp.]
MYCNTPISKRPRFSESFHKKSAGWLFDEKLQKRNKNRLEVLEEFGIRKMQGTASFSGTCSILLSAGF